VRTIDVHGAWEHGAVPRTNASCVETNVTEAAANPLGTGPPAGTVTGWCVFAGAGVAVAGCEAVAGALLAGAALAEVAAGVVAPLPPPEPELSEAQPDSAKVVKTALDRRAAPSRDARNVVLIADLLSPPAACRVPRAACRLPPADGRLPAAACRGEAPLPVSVQRPG
jgi:hypothetical protein